MKRPTVVWLGTAILSIVTIKLGWIAAHTTPNPKYLLSGWTVVFLAALGTIAFCIWPKYLRWIVAPYFILTAIGNLNYLASHPLSAWLAISMVLVFVQAIVGVQLIRMKPESSRSAQTRPTIGPA